MSVDFFYEPGKNREWEKLKPEDLTDFETRVKCEAGAYQEAYQTKSFRTAALP